MEFTDANCPPAVIERVRGADLGVSDTGTLFSWVATESPLECQLHAVLTIADRLDGASHPLVIGDFCASAATYARFFSASDRLRIRAAYVRTMYHASIAHFYFDGVRQNRIDIRDHIRSQIVDDWSFSGPGDENAATWHHYLYLASLDTPGALEQLAEKIAGTEDGNDVANLLESLADLETDASGAVLRRYIDDARVTEGVDGPGMTVGQTVRILLDMDDEEEEDED